MNNEYEEKSERPEKSAGSEKTKPHRIISWILRSLIGIVALVFASVTGGFIFLRTETGEAWLSTFINEQLQSLPGGLHGQIDSFRGPLPGTAILSGIRLEDKKGIWLQADKAQIRIDWSAFPSTFVISELSFFQPRLSRLPEVLTVSEPEKQDIPSSPQKVIIEMKDFLQQWPSWLPEFRVDALNIDHARLSEAFTFFPMIVSLSASATAGSEGGRASAVLQRDDMSYRPISLKVTLSPGLELALDMSGSDLGLTQTYLTEVFRQSELLFSLSGRGPLENWRGRLEGHLKAADLSGVSGTSAVVDVLHLSSAIGFQIPEQSLRGDVRLSLESGPGAAPLWGMAGQKDGHLRMELNLEAEKGRHASLNADSSLILSDMQWGPPLLTAVLGQDMKLAASATLLEKEGKFSTNLEKLTIQAAHIQTNAEGSFHFSPESLPDAQVDFHASCRLDDSEGKHLGKLKKQIGDALLHARLSGPLKALSTEISMESNSLQLPNISFEKTNATVSLRQTDIPRLFVELQKLMNIAGNKTDTDLNKSAALPPSQQAASTPLLLGSASFSSSVNGQKAIWDTDWTLEEKKTTSGQEIQLTLEQLKASLEENTLTGSLSMRLPFFPVSPRKNTLASLTDIALPDLDGSMHLHINRWPPFAKISGLDISGSALDASLRLSSRQGGQALLWKGTLADFRLNSGGSLMTIRGVESDIQVKNLWEVPQINLHLSMDSFQTGKTSLAQMSVIMEGSSEKFLLKADCHGDIQGSIHAGWTPGKCTVEALKVQAMPSLFGFDGTTPVGIQLNDTTVIRYKKNTVHFSPAGLKFFPSGEANFSGQWASDHFSVAAEISEVMLEDFRAFFPQLPAGELSFHADFSGTPGSPAGKFNLNLKNILVPGSSLPRLDGELTGRMRKSGKHSVLEVCLLIPEETRRELGLTKTELQMSLPFTAPAHGISLPDRTGPFHSSIAFSGSLDQIGRLLPLSDQRFSGGFEFDAVLSGSLSAPVITAHLHLNNGRFADIAQGIELQDIRLEADVEKMNLSGKSGKRLILELSAGDGRKGTITCSGWFDPVNLQLDISGSLHRLSPLHRQDVNIMLSGTAGVQGTILQPQLLADIIIDKGQIQLSKLPGGDIVTLDIEEPNRHTQKKLENSPRTIDARIRIPNQFFIRGYGLDCEWKGDLRIQGAWNRPAITGGVQAVRGSLDILNKNFKLAEGNIIFNGGWPVSPALNIVMEYTASSITADIVVNGSVSNPALTLTSEPSMPQDEILSRIMFGQAAGTLSHVQALQLAAGAAELAGFGGGGVMNLGRRLLGVDVFKLNSDNDGKESDVSRTSLEMGTYVRDNIYVGIEQGIGRESETGAVVEIELLPDLEAQAKATGNKTEFGLEWKKNY